MANKVILTAAVTGAVHIPSMSPLFAGHAGQDH